MSMDVGTDSTHEGEGIVDINTTPLIDVMLVLLIMLIITIPLATQSVSVDLPYGDPPPPAKNPPPIVNIGIGYDNQITWNGRPVSDSDLEGLFKEAGSGPKDRRAEVHIQPNRLANYKTVAHVLAQAQRNGVENLGITGLDQYMDDQ